VAVEDERMKLDKLWVINNCMFAELRLRLIKKLLIFLCCVSEPCVKSSSDCT